MLRSNRSVMLHLFCFFLSLCIQLLRLNVDVHFFQSASKWEWTLLVGGNRFASIATNVERLGSAVADRRLMSKTGSPDFLVIDQQYTCTAIVKGLVFMGVLEFGDHFSGRQFSGGDLIAFFAEEVVLINLVAILDEEREWVVDSNSLQQPAIRASSSRSPQLPYCC